MSVHDPEPEVPNDDNGKGLRMIGWFLLIWAGISVIWIPPHTWWTSWMAWVSGLCLIGGLLFVGIGYYVAWKAPSETEIGERAHDLIAASEDGSPQTERFATNSGPGKFPKRVERTQ